MNIILGAGATSTSVGVRSVSPSWQLALGIGSLIVAIAGAVFGLWMNLRTQRNANKSEASKNQAAIFETATKSLIDQYQEQNSALIEEMHDCHGRCAELESKVAALHLEIREMQAKFTRLLTEKDTVISNQEAELIGLRVRLGELGGST